MGFSLASGNVLFLFALLLNVLLFNALFNALFKQLTFLSL